MIIYNLNLVNNLSKEINISNKEGYDSLFSMMGVICKIKTISENKISIDIEKETLINMIEKIDEDILCLEIDGYNFYNDYNPNNMISSDYKNWKSIDNEKAKIILEAYIHNYTIHNRLLLNKNIKKLSNK